MRTRLFVLPTAIISTAGLVLAILTAPSQAQTSPAAKSAAPARTSKPDYVQYPSYCLNNTPHHEVRCLGGRKEKPKTGPRDVEGTVDVIIGAIALLLYVWEVMGPRGPGKHRGGKHEKFTRLKVAGDLAQGAPSSPVRGSCLADKGGDAYFGNCTTLESEWYLVPYRNGFAMESVYCLRHVSAAPYYLTVTRRSQNARPYAALAGTDYQVWTWI